MRQIWITKPGEPQVLKIKESPTPIPKNGQVRIKVEAAGINPVDILCRQGRYNQAPSTPFVPGLEVSGTIDAVAQGINDFKEGDKVLAYTRFGGYSDTVCVPYYQVFKRLEWMNAIDGAAIIVDYLTAFVALVVMGSLRTGNRVFIHDAHDCRGLALLAICQINGAWTYGTALSKYHAFLQERGLNHPIDWREADYEDVILQDADEQGLDIIIARYGESDWAKNYRLLSAAGRLVYLEGTSLNSKKISLFSRLKINLTKPTYKLSNLIDDNKSISGFNIYNLWEDNNRVQEWMAQIISWYDEALFRPVIDKTFLFSEAQQAHEYLQDGRNKGKIILVPDDASTETGL